MFPENKRGFILGVILLLCLVMAAFIFSYNSIVRSRNLQAHHYMSSELVNNLAVSGVKLLSSKVGNTFAAAIENDCPQLFNLPVDRIAQPIEVSSFRQFCADVKADYQKFLNQLVELKEPGVIGGGFPVCQTMEVSIDRLQTLAPVVDRTQLQRGRDAIEKGGFINLTCVVKYAGLTRRASISQQFRIVNMVPGPIARFSLFVGKTPYPDSYNAMGVDFDGNVDSTYSHPAAGNKTFTGPLVIINGTDTQRVTNSVSFLDGEADKRNLRERGWIYLGPSGPTGNGPVYLKIPNGFSPATGGLFMFGRPSAGAVQLLAPARIQAGDDFRRSEEVADHDFHLASKYQGFYTSEKDRPMGVGAHNLWPGLATGNEFQPSDRFLAASTWLYPYGTMNESSRTLVIGPVLAGYLKYFYIKGRSRNNSEYRGLFSSLSSDSFSDKSAAGKELLDFCYIWSGMADPSLAGADFFKNGYSSFKKIMPWNSLPSNSSGSLVKGVSFNMLFDFMKYNRSRYPDVDAGPGISQNEFNNLPVHVPLAYEMQQNQVKGVHPSGNLGIFFNDNGQFSPEANPENCYFYGDLGNFSVENSSLNPRSQRLTNVISLASCTSIVEENSMIEQILFKQIKKDNKTYNEPRKSGIFLIIRRPGVGLDYADALQITSKDVFLSRPMILVFREGSLNLGHDFIAELHDGAPEVLLSLAVMRGDVYLSGAGSQRTIHAYIAAVGNNAGRLLKPSGSQPAPGSFEIFGGLALSELGLYQDMGADPRAEVGSTMLHFPAGGKVRYNSRFNPSLSHYSQSYQLVIEQNPGTLNFGGDRN